MASLSITNDVKNKTDRYLITRHCLVCQGNVCTKYPNMRNVTTVFSKLFNLFNFKGTNDRRFEDILSEMGSEWEMNCNLLTLVRIVIGCLNVCMT